MLLQPLNLLDLACKLHLKEEARTKGTGEAFNVFKILHVGHYEARTHTPLLAELLNPRGRHGQGAIFLHHFLKLLEIHAFDAESARVKCEVHIGRRTAEEGGRIDILIMDRLERKIVIENKIYAVEQQNQLGRYQDYAPDAPLIFLTLQGDSPDGTPPASLRNLKCVSYRRDILRWLEKCQEAAEHAPCVRETITQYIHLIQELTQQNTSNLMNKELIEAALRSRENYLAYTALLKVQGVVRATIVGKLSEKLNSIAGELKLNLTPKPIGDMSANYSGFNFSSQLLQKLGVKICFQFQASGYRSCIFGFSYINGKDGCPATSQLQEEFRLEFGRYEPPTGGWPAFLYWEDHRNWTDETFATIQFGDFDHDLKKLLERLLSIANRVSTALDSLLNV